jgi:hypothetical protein
MKEVRLDVAQECVDVEVRTVVSTVDVHCEPPWIFSIHDELQ